MLASRHIKREKASLPVDVRGSKMSLLKVPIVLKEGVHCQMGYGSQGCKYQAGYTEGLSLKTGDWGFPLATINMTPGYFHWKIEENRTKRNQ